MYEQMDEPSEIKGIFRTVEKAEACVRSIKLPSQWKEVKSCYDNALKSWAKGCLQSIDIREYNLK